MAGALGLVWTVGPAGAEGILYVPDLGVSEKWEGKQLARRQDLEHQTTQLRLPSLQGFFFFFFFLKILAMCFFFRSFFFLIYFYIFIFGCVGSLLLCEGFL